MRDPWSWIVVALSAVGLAILAPRLAAAQDDSEEDEEAAAEEDADEETSEEDDVDTEDLFGADDELPPEAGAGDEEEEESSAPPEKVEPKLLRGTWTRSIVFATDDGQFEFQPRGWVQPRFGMSIVPDNDDTLAGTGFTLKRARFGFQAKLFDWARIYLDSGFASGQGRLVDYFVDIDPFDGIAALRVGHFRPWFSRQFLMSTTRLQMVEYAQAWQDPVLGLGVGRDLGASIFGMIADTVEYGVGAWNGEEDKYGLGPIGTENDLVSPGNIDFEVGGRIAVHPLGPMDAGEPLPLGDESDSAISDKPRLVVGGAVLYNKRHNNEVEIAPDVWNLYYDHQLKIGAELAFQWMGFSFMGELFWMQTKVQDDADPAIKAAVRNLDGEPTGLGTYAQLGYFVMPRQLEIAARFDMVDEDTAVRGTRLYPGVGTTYYLHGNNLKAQLMYRLSVGPGYEKPDPNYIPMGHEIFLMLQASI